MLIQSTNSGVSAPAMPASNGGQVVVASQPAGQPVQAEATPPTPAQLSSEVGRINAALQQANRNVELSISVDDSTKKQVVTLKDKTTGDTLLQYPSEAVLAISRSIDEFQQGQLLNRQA
ncbi:hypothetical protein TK5_07870 [Sideroxyarcus sp. TK5]